MRCQSWSVRLWVRGLDSPSESRVRAASKRWAKRSTMARSLAARLGEAIQAHLLAVVAEDLVQMHAVMGGGLDGQRRVGVEVAGAFAADHQVAVLVLAQPAHAVFGGDAAVHDHQGAARGVEGVEHLGEGVMFAHVAGEDLGAAHEAAGVEHQSQGEQRAVGALVLGVSAPGLGLSARLALEVGIGQVVEGDGGVEVEQVHRPVEEVAFDGFAVCHQRIGGAVQSHRPHRLEVHAQEFAQGAALAQPAPGGALGAWPGHARDDGADGGGAYRRPDAQCFEPCAQAELVHRPQAGVLHADRAGANQFQGVDVDVLEVVPRARWRGCGADALTGEQQRGDALGV